MDSRLPVSGTLVMDSDFLIAENPYLAERARIPFTVGDDPALRSGKEEKSGMVMAAAVPVFEGNLLIGVLYGGMLLNRSETLVDTVRGTVFQGETYKGRNVGTATIFLGDARISTNVMTADGQRALGTRVSPEVREHVLGKGKLWTDRAFVVSDWYITAYRPIEDLSGQGVGMLYVGVLEDKYEDIRRETLAVYILITEAGMLLAVGLGYLVANRISAPIQRLINASQQVSEGSLTPELGAPAFFIENLFAQHLVHEVVLAMVAWVVFGILLFGRWRFGWRGRQALRWRLGGYVLLGLSYFGSKLILENVLGKHWG